MDLQEKEEEEDEQELVLLPIVVEFAWISVLVHTVVDVGGLFYRQYAY